MVQTGAGKGAGRIINSSRRSPIPSLARARRNNSRYLRPTVDRHEAWTATGISTRIRDRADTSDFIVLVDVDVSNITEDDFLFSPSEPFYRRLKLNPMPVSASPSSLNTIVPCGPLRITSSRLTL